MKQGVFTVENNIPLTENVYKMQLLGDTAAITAPGQFVNIRLEGKFLRRPISVCDCEEGRLTIIYKVVGSGTEIMSRLSHGDALDVLSGLGNGYDLDRCKDAPLLIGGGVGVPPMYLLAKKLIEKGKRVSVILGFNTASEVFFKEEFEAIGADVTVTTVDGSMGTKGFVTDAMAQMKEYSFFYTCGPMPMLRAVYTESKTSGQLSFEERMGCGFGACMGCSCKTITGYKRICKEGPVLSKEEILWDK